MRPSFENLNGIQRSEHPGYHCSIFFFVLLSKCHGRLGSKEKFIAPYSNVHYTTLEYTTLHYTTLRCHPMLQYAIIAINVRPYRRSTGYRFSCSGRLKLHVSDKIQLFSSLRNHSLQLCPHIVLAANLDLRKGRLRVRGENNP